MDKLSKIDSSKLSVIEPDILIIQGNSFTLPQYRIILLALSSLHVKSLKDLSYKDLLTLSDTAMEIPLETYSKTYHLTNADGYDSIRRAMKETWDKTFLVPAEFCESSSNIKSNSIGKVGNLRLITYQRYDAENGAIIIKFSIDFLKLLSHCGIDIQYTSMLLSNICKLQSKYGVKLYEICKKYQKLGSATFNIIQDYDKGKKNLKDILSIPNGYKSWEDVRRFVIIPALREINEHTDITVEFEKVMQRNKTAMVLFKIKGKGRGKAAVNAKGERVAVVI